MHRLKEKVQEKVDKRVHGRKWKGSIELETKSRFLQAVPDLWRGLISDTLHDLVGCTVLFELVGIDHAGSGRSNQSGKKNMKSKPNLFGGYTVGFRVAKDFGEPAALLVQSHLSNPFFLRHVTLKSDDKSFHFPCYSWIYNYKNYKSCERIFFTNEAYLPGKTPSGLQKWRVQALEQLRGESGSAAGRDGERAEYDRVYDYDVYNDLGNPDLQADLRREVLGGPSSELPYPRRCKTGRKPTSTDQRSERPTMLLKNYYVPRDEQFDSLKNSSIAIKSIKSFIPYILPTVLSQIRAKLVQKEDFRSKFSSYLEIFKLYSKISWSGEEGSGSITSKILEIGESLHLISKTIKQLLEDPIGYLLHFSLPQIIQAKGMYHSKEWKTDEEFGRQTLAGINPLVIERVKELPKEIDLAIKLKGRTHLDDHLTVKQAIGQNRLYIVDYYDAFLPFVEKVNKLEDSKMYASRTVLFLTRDGTLKPIAIELSPSENDGDSRVFFPPTENSQEEWIWNLAKAHATINDAAYHELISHWLRTHACMEPFIIATHRTLSALHPINVLLGPHFKDTLQINALARQLLINAHKADDILPGIIEMGFCTDKYSMEFSSAVYKKTWRLDEQALPRDLIKRGMAVEDPTSKEHKLRLYVEDYPYAVDGLDIWFAIESWVDEYISIYYFDDKAVQEDYELKNWWSEIKEQGHGDKKNETWWVKMTSREDLKEVVVTLIWIASAHHAAVNFGQYAYGGFMPTRPTRASKLIPREGTEDYENLMMTDDSSEKMYLDSLSSQKQATVVMATLEILSNHAPNEEYLGQRTTPHWTSNAKVLQAFNKFQKQINDIEKKIHSRNEDPRFKNRHGLVQLPYTLLVPSSVPGITGRGVPNSISI